MPKQKIKKVVPDISFTEDLIPSRVMIQFDNDEPQPVMDLLSPEAKVTFELTNTKFGSMEFNDEKTKKKFKIFIKQKE